MATPDENKPAWMAAQMEAALSAIGSLRAGVNEDGAEVHRHVLLYASGFLQKPQAPQGSITHEDINGFMTTIYGMDWARNLTLVLHTPGGVTNAAETIVDYLRSKFADIEVIVPTFAMSAGTMISLASDRVVMARSGQLGPIDPQLPYNGRFVSARAIVEQFDRAKTEVLDNQTTAHLWAPIVQSLGPALLQESQNALDYGESMVAKWLAQWMCAGSADPATKGKNIAKHFNDASTHKSHGRRISRDECRSQGVTVEDLEDSQTLQEAVLTVYHLSTLMFENSPAIKVLWADTGRTWIKNWAQPVPQPSSSIEEALEGTVIA